VALDGLHRVVRAGRIKAARAAEKRSQNQLVRPQKNKQQTRADRIAVRHGGRVYFSALVSKSISSRSMAANGAVATELRG
jgi:hypothetical protein